MTKNVVSKASIRTAKPLMAGLYRENRATRSIILIDDATNKAAAPWMTV